jgi:diketogulonate reductase-like aldo/keto reductase
LTPGERLDNGNWCDTMNKLSRRDALQRMAAFAAALPCAWQTPRSMITRSIPVSGEKLPVIGLGTWQTFDVAGEAALQSLFPVLQRFHALGGRVIDSSPMYGRSESVTGELVARLKAQNGFFVATKVWTRGERAGSEQMSESLVRLRVRTIDLMQVHNLVDADTHLRTLEKWKAEGRVRYIGVTHYQDGAYDSLERYLARGGIDFVQFNYSLAERSAERRMLSVAAERRVAVLINRPFAAGNMFARVRGKALPGWAAEIDCQSWAQVFLKYVVSHPAVTCAIPATSDVKHLEDNMGAGVGRLPEETLRRRIAADWDKL